MIRRHHYEAAFEDFLRSHGVPYIAVDEHRRAVFNGCRVKSFDFMVYFSLDHPWLVDIKGRKFPYISDDGQRKYWENWVTREDLDGLSKWKEAFGESFSPVLVFAYWLCEEEDRKPTTHTHLFRNHEYAFLAVPLDQYQASCQSRSPRWETVSMPTSCFRELAVPIQKAIPGRFTDDCPAV